MADLFKDLVYSQEDIVTFNDGIPGFDKYKKYVLVNLPQLYPFEWLVCVDNPDLKFAIINPLLFKSEYNPKISKFQIEDLEFDKPEDISLYTIATLAKNPADTTANLMAPIVINKAKRLAKQVILDGSPFSLKERIIK